MDTNTIDDTENQEIDTGIEVVVGTYEHFLVGYKLILKNDEDEETYSLKQSFTNNSHCGSIRALGSVGKYIGSGSTDEVIRLINLVSRTEHGSLQQHSGTITCLTNYTANYLFSGSSDGTICIWKTGSWICEKTLYAHEGGVNDLTIHPTGKLALSVGQDKALKTWNLIKGRCGYITNLKAIGEAVQWSTEGNYYAVSINNRVDIYSLESAKVVYSVPFGKRVSHIVFMDDTHFLIAGESEEVQIHSIEDFKLLTRFPAHKNRIKGIQYLDDQRLLVTVSNSDSMIKVWKFPQDQDYSSITSPPNLLCEVNTACRITCLTVWDKSTVPLQKNSQQDIEVDVEDVEEPLLTEMEPSDDEMEIEEEEEEEEDEELPPPPPRKSKTKVKSKSSTSAPPSSKTPEDQVNKEFLEHRKLKRRRKN